MKQKEFNEIVNKHAEKYGKKMTLHVVGGNLQGSTVNKSGTRNA